MDKRTIKYKGPKEEFDKFVGIFAERFTLKKKAGFFKDCILFILRTINGIDVFEVVIVKQNKGETIQQTGERVGILKTKPKPDLLGRNIEYANSLTLTFKPNTVAKQDPKIVAIDKAIKELTAAKTAIENATGFHRDVETKGRGTWVIEDNRYFQFDRIEGNTVVVNRKGNESVYTFGQFNGLFRLANAAEVAQHERYLSNTGGKQISTKKLVGYRLKISFAGYRNAVVTLAGVSTLPKYFPTSGIGWANLKKAGVENWFEEVYEETPIKSAAAPLIDPLKCDFYMVTCRGQRGAKVRHTSFDEAYTEATRMAEQEQHQCWVVGVVATVKPK